MSAASTLARRFRSQRTDRIRLDAEAVFSKVDFEIEGPTILEVAFESMRTDFAEGLVVHADDMALTVAAIDGSAARAPRTAADQLSLIMPPDSLVQLACDGSAGSSVTLWNLWMHEGSEHAWTGNSGILLEHLDPPDGASERVRLWCSDGLGNVSFDDLVVVVTIGSA